jgi:hypothetical protein
MGLRQITVIISHHQSTTTRSMSIGPHLHFSGGLILLWTRTPPRDGSYHKHRRHHHLAVAYIISHHGMLIDTPRAAVRPWRAFML